jgi:hypothetical protein
MRIEEFLIDQHNRGKDEKAIKEKEHQACRGGKKERDTPNGN